MVAIFPLLAVFALESSGVVRSPLVATAVGVVFSVSLARLGSWMWIRSSGSRDLVFGDLMLWGWLKRIRTEKRLARSVEQLGLDRSGARVKSAEIPAERQTDVLRKLASSLESGDPFTHGHTKRVTRYSYMLAKTMRLPQETVNKIRAAAAVHDVGKIETPLEILNKPGALTDEEFEIMKRHSAVGAEMVEQLGDPEITAMVRHHHERMDGTGYPDQLSGTDIPLGARVIAVADTFDAIISTRPYRKARRHKDAIEILERVAGTQLDERAVYAFLSYYSGRKPLAWWLSFSSAVQRVLGSAGGWLQQAQGASQGAMSLATAVALATASVTIPGVADWSRRNSNDNKSLVAVERVSVERTSSDLVGGTDVGSGPGTGSHENSDSGARNDARHSVAGSGSGGAAEGLDTTDEGEFVPATGGDDSDEEVVNSETPTDFDPAPQPNPGDDDVPPRPDDCHAVARAKDEDGDCEPGDDDDDDGDGDGGTDGTDGDDSAGTDGANGDDSDENVTGDTDGTDGDNSNGTDPIDGDNSDPGGGEEEPPVDVTDGSDGDNTHGTDGTHGDDSDENVTGDTDGTDGDNSNGTDPLDGDDSDVQDETDGDFTDGDTGNESGNGSENSEEGDESLGNNDNNDVVEGEGDEDGSAAPVDAPEAPVNPDTPVEEPVDPVVEVPEVVEPDPEVVEEGELPAEEEEMPEGVLPEEVDVPPAPSPGEE